MDTRTSGGNARVNAYEATREAARETAREAARETTREAARDIAGRSGVALHECNQCGKCTAGCPMSHAMDIMPRQIVRLMQIGELDEVLRSKAIWLCAACGICAERCPYGINLPSLIENARQEAKRRNICALREVDVFTEAFLGNIATFGKSQEAILEGLYNTLTGNLTQDMAQVPHMLRHGLIKPEIRMAGDREGISKLMKAALETDGEDWGG